MTSDEIVAEATRLAVMAGADEDRATERMKQLGQAIAMSLPIGDLEAACRERSIASVSLLLHPSDASASIFLPGPVPSSWGTTLIAHAPTALEAVSRALDKVPTP